MESFIKKQTSTVESSSTALSMQKQPHLISKPKPKIRIIHVFAPEIMKTDAANFRELVQRLTGKPTDHHLRQKKRKRIKKQTSLITERQENVSSTEMIITSKNVEVRGGFHHLKENQALTWHNNKTGESSSGYLNGFAELDGFIKELGEFRYFPIDANPDNQLAWLN